MNFHDFHTFLQQLVFVIRMSVLIVVVLFFLRGLDRIMVSFHISFDTSIVLLFIVILFGNLDFFSFLEWSSESSSHVKDTHGSSSLFSFLIKRVFSSSCPLDKYKIKAWNWVFCA